MKRQIAAIEFGTSKIVTVIAQNSGLDRLNIVGSGTVPYDGYSEGDWNTPRQMVQRVRDSIAAAELEAGTKVREIYVGIPGEYIHVRVSEAEVEAPEGVIDESVVDAVQDLAADKLQLAGGGCMVLHRSPAWYIVDGGKKTMAPGGRGNRLRAQVAFIVAESMFIEDVSEMLRVLDIAILGFLSPSLGESLLLLPRGGGHVAADLATELRISMRAAEQIKRNYVFNPDEFDRDSFSEVYDESGRRMTFPREMVQDIVERSVGELMEMIELTINNDAAGYLGARSQVYLTGGGLALMRGAREYLSARIGRPVKVAAVKTAKLNSPVFASALGLADLIFDSIEQHEDGDAPVLSKVRNFFRGRNAE